MCVFIDRINYIVCRFRIFIIYLICERCFLKLIVEDLTLTLFEYPTSIIRDTDGHTHPGPERSTTGALLTVVLDNGAKGYVTGSPNDMRRDIIDSYIRPVVYGQNPFDRERLWQGMARWQRGSGGQLTDKTLANVELALWDVCGRLLQLPVWRLIGGFRSKVPAYGSTMCGDEIQGGLATPQDYANFAIKLKNKGYQAIKLHTWMPPVSFAPSVKMDIAACAAVREAVGKDFPLMLDANHWYSRTQAYELGIGIQKLGYYWYEEPMDEHSMSSYKWLAANLDIPVLGPEYVEGKFHSRAEWISSHACDISRAGVMDVGGIMPTLKIAHLSEAFNMDCEIHGGGAGNLAVLGAIHNARWYERGLLHPFIDYDKPPPYLNTIIDHMDSEGFIHMPDKPGLGEDINFEYIENNAIGKY